MKTVDIDKLAFKNEHWKQVFTLVDKVQVRYDPKFGMRGTQLHDKWGAAYEQVVNIMYWVDRLSRNSPINPSTTGKTMAVRNGVHLRHVAYELRTTIDAIHNILLLDPEYDGEIDAL